MNLTFLGANRQVTGSRYCLEAAGTKIMIDCGMVQEREHAARNWNPCPVSCSEFAAVILTHVHIDHCGLIPKFVRDGFHGPIYATKPSVDLVGIMLRDAARIQVEDAKYKNGDTEKKDEPVATPKSPSITKKTSARRCPYSKASYTTSL